MKIHIVQKGDTLWKIAKKYGVDFEELKKMNAQLSNPDMIMPGMKIKVPAGGTAVKKEKPKTTPGGHKEVPKEQPKKQPPKPTKVPKEVKKEKPKELPKKEVPQKIYQPVMPQPLPEIDINNYYMMHMNQMQAQVQQQPPKEVEHVKDESPEMEVMPIQGGMPEPMPMPMPMPMYPMYHCPPPVMPVCDPCYPYPMPYAHGMMGYPHMPMGGYMPMHGAMPMYGQMPMHGVMPMHGEMPVQGQMPMQAEMPMYGQMPAVMGAAEHGVMPHHWGDESSSCSPSMDMMHHHANANNPHNPYNPHGYHHMQSPDYMDDSPYQAMPMHGSMPMHGWSQPYGGYPMTPAQPQGMQQMGTPMGSPMGAQMGSPMGTPMGTPYGTMPYGQPHQYEPLPGAGAPPHMMPRVDEDEDD